MAEGWVVRCGSSADDVWFTSLALAGRFARLLAKKLAEAGGAPQIETYARGD